MSGYNFETPVIGDCTNAAPKNWMSMILQAQVSGLTSGVAYNLYKYDISGVSGTGGAAALAVPTSAFNAHAAMATEVTHFVATGPTYAHTIQTTSDRVIVFRAVAATAP
jgi:hypothetical protein